MLQVNGCKVAAEVEPRTNLADFLRDHLDLTGTHVGCEHGVCGACTLLIDGNPARSCIALPATLAGAQVTTIEGLEDDPVMARLRAAFTAEHALQCGYCTPGMLVTARDIVLRLPQADAARIRLELAGNLCRCTGYDGIVKAILRVLGEGPFAAAVPLAAVPTVQFGTFEAAAPAPVAPAQGKGLDQMLHLAAAPDAVWSALRDPALVASCIPGVALTLSEGERIEGELAVAFGPIRARFKGAARLTFDDATRTGVAEGEGRDTAGGTRLTAKARFAVTAEGTGTRLDVGVEQALSGPLAQLGRSAIVELFAAELAGQFARNLEDRLAGRAPAAAPARLGLGRSLGKVLWLWLRSLGARR